jgi:hypothetical protein
MPGDDTHHAVIRRWISPIAGTLDIKGELTHRQPENRGGDGLRVRIVHSRAGKLLEQKVRGGKVDAALKNIGVREGDSIDFIVDGIADPESDNFTWGPEIESRGKIWNAAKDFRGPDHPALDVWEKYAQVLLETNEFAFVD